MYAKTKQQNGRYYLKPSPQSEWIEIHRELYLDIATEEMKHKEAVKIRDDKASDIAKVIFWFLILIAVIGIGAMFFIPLYFNSGLQ